ncbi:MAG: DUF4139 domain-containing protein [Bacteroidota bacterium]
MKKHLRAVALLLCGLGCVAFSFAQPTPEPRAINSKISTVKVHLEGAEIFREVTLDLKRGRNYFVFSGLSSKLYPETVQLMSEAETAEVVSLTSKTNFLEKRKEQKRTLDLRDSVRIIREKITAYTDEMGAYAAERKLLDDNRSFKGEDKTLTVAELRATAEFYRSQTLAINEAISKLDRRIAKLNRRLFDLKLQLFELNAGQDPTSDVFVVVDASQAGPAEITLRYVVSDAGWAAIYDLESGDLSAPITLQYRALAFNNTGVDWSNVRMSLSTKDPLATAAPPKLKVWSLDDYAAGDLTANQLDLVRGQYKNNYDQSIGIYNEIQQGYQNKVAEVRTIMGGDFAEGVDYDTDLYRRYRARQLSKPRLVEASIDVPEFAIEFNIDGAVSVPSDNKPYSIDIEEHKLPATYKYLAVPKLDRDAFLLAQIVGWEELNLISGPVNIYHGNRFVGQSNLDIRNLSDTLEVSLGRDQNVVVTRLKVKGKSRRQLLGSTNKSSVAYNITARNNHNKPINLEIRDQVPITSDREVIITVDEMAGATYAEKTGRLSWNFSLQPGASQTMEFGFTIKYPRTKSVRIQYNESRNVMQKRAF